MKHIYRTIGFLAVFAAALIIFAGQKKESSLAHDTAVEMGGASFPVLYVENRGKLTNPLHGYSSKMKEGTVRESLTTIAGTQGEIKILVEEEGYEAKKVYYELSDLSGNVKKEDSILAFSEEDGKKFFRLSFSDLEEREEYSLSMTVVTETNKKIHYYTRVKCLTEDHLEEKLDFVLDFQKKTMDLDKVKSLASYLETSSKAQTESLAHVDITSPLEMIGWGGLQPEVRTEIVPVVKEMSEDTAAVQLNYMAAGTTANGEELYQVCEFYRIRYTASRVYLLDYERTMESVYDSSFTSLSQNELKLGIMQEEEGTLAVSEDGTKVAFVKNRELWYLKTAENTLTRVFSFQEEEDYERTFYNQHEIQLLNMDEDGNLDFLVFGYLNGGDYEGKVAVILYRYYAAEESIREKVFIPVNIPYQMMKEDVKNFAYVTPSDLFYFAMNHSIFCYDISARSFKTVAEEVSDSSYAASADQQYVVWQESADPSESRKLCLLDLNTGIQQEIQAPAGERIVVFGKTNENMIYGLVKEEAISQKGDGTWETPAYQINIADGTGKVLKEYSRSGRFVTGVSVEGNIVTMQLAKKSGKSYKETDTDYIINRTVAAESRVSLTTRVTEAAYTEYYISLGKNLVMKEAPEVEEARMTVISEDLTLHLDTDNWSRDRYYVYGRGRILGYETTAGRAVAAADEAGGTVTDPDNRTIWSRGDRPLRNGIKTVTVKYGADGGSTLITCVKMLLDSEKLYYREDDLSGEKTAAEMLECAEGVTALNLTGCTLEQVFYYIGRNQPVIAMKDSKNAVLIFGYDTEYVKFADLAAGITSIIRISQAAELFEKAGNKFYCYSR